jgi:hypothetical protein
VNKNRRSLPQKRQVADQSHSEQLRAYLRTLAQIFGRLPVFSLPLRALQQSVSDEVTLCSKTTLEARFRLGRPSFR